MTDRELDDQFFRNRISQLRVKANLSEYELSRAMGHNRTYIQNIVSGKSRLPHTELLELCRLLKITPEQFFSADIENPALVLELMEEAKKMPDDDIQLVLRIVRRMNGN